MRRQSLLPLLLLVAVGVHAQPVDYTISARLDDRAGLIRGSETFIYRNLTQDTLGTLWLHLYANAFRDRTTDYARELEAMGRFDFSLLRRAERGSIAVNWTESGGRVCLVSEAGTELGLHLNPPLPPGESVTISLGFHTKVPARFGEPVRNGPSFVLAHWYPEIAAREPGTGWLLGGYHVFGHSPPALADYHVTLDMAAYLNLATTGLLSDSGMPGPEPGHRVFDIEAANVSGLAVVAAPGMKRVSRSIAGTNITILAKSFANAEWSGALLTVADMLLVVQEWNGPFPFPCLTIADGSGVVAEDASYPGLIVMATQPIPFTRLFEQALPQQIALQWSSCATGTDELSNPTVAQGQATYSAMRYMDDKYGRTSLVSNPLAAWLLAGLNAEYYNKLYYYLGASNKVLCTDPTECRDRTGYQAAFQSRPALMLFAKEREIGRAAFDSLMRERMLPGTHTLELDSSLGLHHSSIAGIDSILPYRLGDHSVTARPIFALPSFSTYQIFFGPYVWADYYHGVRFAAWAQGRQFFDAGPLRGRHQWAVSETYSTKIKGDFHSSVNYQTPLTCINDRLRVYAALDYSRIDEGAKLYFSQELGPVFRQPKTTIDLGYRFLALKDTEFRDPRAWDSARTADIRIRLAQTYESRLLLGGAQVYVRNGMTALGSEFNYLRVGVEQSCTWRGLRPVDLTLRLFGGYVWGDVPKQDRFYLSGGLTSNAAEPISWSHSGWTSGQENWHYDADVNCRGWAGEYLHGRIAYGVNFEANAVRFGFVSLSPFLDVGNVREDTTTTADFIQPRLDAGIRLKLGPLYADFPLWRYWSIAGGHQFAFRWMLGLKLSGNLSSS